VMPPPIVETTVREPAPTAESGTPPSEEQPATPLLEREGQIAQPVSPQEEPAAEKVPEPAVTERMAPPPRCRRWRPPEPHPDWAPTVEPAKTRQQDAEKRAPTRRAESARSRTARQKQRRSRTSPQPAVVTPAAPVQSAPSVRTSNPWESPASTGFNQK